MELNKRAAILTAYEEHQEMEELNNESNFGEKNILLYVSNGNSAEHGRVRRNRSADCSHRRAVAGDIGNGCHGRNRRNGSPYHPGNH